MSYLTELSNHWAYTIQLVRLQLAEQPQLDALRSLAETEFGYRSNLRLRKDCFWRPFVDKDGDVVLTFIEPYTLGDDGSTRHGARVNVYIDHVGVLTIKDLLTDEVSVYNPYDEVKGWKAGTDLIWVLDERLLKPFTEPCIKVESNWDTLDLELHVTETGEIFAPYLVSNSYAEREKTGHMAFVQYLTPPTEGFGLARADGKLAVYNEVYEDEVSGERVYALRELTGRQAALVHLARFKVAIEQRINKMGWTKSGRFQFKTGVRTTDLVTNPITAYTMF